MMLLKIFLGLYMLLMIAGMFITLDQVGKTRPPVTAQHAKISVVLTGVVVFMLWLTLRALP